MYRHKSHHLDTLLTHPLEELALDIPTAHIVVDDSYLHPLTGLGDEGIGNQRAQGIVGKDIHIHVDMTAGLTDLLQQGREELIAVGIDVHLIIFERQGEVLVDEEVDKRFLFLRQTEVLLFDELQHRAFRQLVHTPFTDIAFLASVDAEEKVEHNTCHRHEPNHQRPGKGLGGLPVVEHHVDNSQDGDQLRDDDKYNVPTHLITSLPS